MAISQELENLYQQIILEHYKRKVGFATLPSEYDGISYQVNPSCGDQVTLIVQLDATKLINLVWHGDGCSISQASLSLMTEMVLGLDTDDIFDLINKFNLMLQSKNQAVDEEILDALGDASVLQGVSKFPARIKCALLGWMALKDALAQALAKQ